MFFSGVIPNLDESLKSESLLKQVLYRPDILSVANVNDALHTIKLC